MTMACSAWVCGCFCLPYSGLGLSLDSGTLYHMIAMRLLILLVAKGMLGKAVTGGLAVNARWAVTCQHIAGDKISPFLYWTGTTPRLQLYELQDLMCMLSVCLILCGLWFALLRWVCTGVVGLSLPGQRLLVGPYSGAK